VFVNEGCEELGVGEWKSFAHGLESGELKRKSFAHGFSRIGTDCWKWIDRELC